MRTAQASAAKPRPASPARTAWHISDGSLEALKWFALVLMAGDHVNKYLLHEANATLFALGRLVMPVFGFVLMFNLARPGALATGTHVRVIKRLTLFGGLSTPAFVYLVGWWPLNILFTLWVATLLVYLWEGGGKGLRVLAVLTFLIGGAFVEFWWPALLCCLTAWVFILRPTAVRLVLWTLATTSLAVVNGNFAAVVALPLIWGATQVDIPLPRNRWVFYAFYPAHLTLLALCSATR